MVFNVVKFVLIFNLFFLMQELFAANFTSSNKKNCSYIFAPGLTSTEMQLAKYLPYFKASTGEIISSNSGIHTVNMPIDICKFAEINFQPLKDKEKMSIFNPSRYLYYFFNNYSSGKFSVNVEKQARLKLAKTLTSYTILVSKINIGQKQDVKCLAKTYSDHIAKFSDNNIILYGASRGAAAVFNFLAKYKPKQVKAVILEGIFDSVHNLLRQKIGFLHHLVENLLMLLTSYKKDGMAPINNVSKIPKDIPILLITSRVDESVPYHCTLNLYRALKANNHEKVYILVLNRSCHVGYICDDKEDKEIYEAVVHAFYKHFNLPYDKNLSKKGSAKFKLCDPKINLLI